MYVIKFVINAVNPIMVIISHNSSDVHRFIQDIYVSIKRTLIKSRSQSINIKAVWSNWLILKSVPSTIIKFNHSSIIFLSSAFCL